MEIETIASVAGSNGVDLTGFIFSAGILASVLFIASLLIFVLLAIRGRSRSIKTFQSQISVFIGVYVVGELLELNAIPMFAKLPGDTGSQIHVAATIVLTAILWTRFVYSEKIVKKLVDSGEGSNLLVPK